MNVTREIQISGLSFIDEMSPWAGDFAADFDWDAIEDEFNDELAKRAPEGISWGWRSQPFAYATMSYEGDEVRDLFTAAIEAIDFESIATKHEKN